MSIRKPVPHARRAASPGTASIVKHSFMASPRPEAWFRRPGSAASRLEAASAGSWGSTLSPSTICFRSNFVLADGRFVTASADENSDLFWALRGGGGNFGVAASLEYRLHPVGPVITGGVIAYPFSEAWDVLRFFRDITASLPDELMVFGGLIHAPDGSGTKLVGNGGVPLRSPGDGERAIQPIKSFGAPVMDALGPVPYCEMNTMLDAGFPPGALNYWKSAFLAGLSDEAIRTMIDCFAQMPDADGCHCCSSTSMARSPALASRTPHSLTGRGHNLLVLSQWAEPKDNTSCTAWARDSYAAMAAFMGGGTLRELSRRRRTGRRGPAAYGPNYRRLARSRRKYDPDNFFRMNQNIRPAA